MIIIAVFIGWWLGNRDKLVLIQENEKIINDFKLAKYVDSLYKNEKYILKQ